MKAKFNFLNRILLPMYLFLIVPADITNYYDGDNNFENLLSCKSKLSMEIKSKNKEIFSVQDKYNLHELYLDNNNSGYISKNFHAILMDSTQESHFKSFNSINLKESQRIRISEITGLLSQYIREIKSSPNSKYLAFYSVNPSAEYFTLKIYDIENNIVIDPKELQKIENYGRTFHTSISFSPNSDQLSVFLNRDYLQIISLQDGTELYNFEGPQKLRYIHISDPGLYFNQKTGQLETNESYFFSGHKNIIVKLNSDKQLFDALRTETGDQTINHDAHLEYAVFYLPNNIIAGHGIGFTKEIYICDLLTGNINKIIHCDKTLLYDKLRFSADGSMIMGIQKANLAVWDVNTGLIEKEIAHEKAVWDFDVTNNNLLVTCSYDKKIHLWNINEDFKEIKTIIPTNKKGKEVYTRFVFFTTDGSKLCCITFKNDLIIYDIEYNY